MYVHGSGNGQDMCSAYHIIRIILTESIVVSIFPFGRSVLAKVVSFKLILT